MSFPEPISVPAQAITGDFSVIWPNLVAVSMPEARPTTRSNLIRNCNGPGVLHASVAGGLKQASR